MTKAGIERTPGSQSSLREANQRRVLQAIRQAGSLTQAEIARGTGLSPATVSNIVRELHEAGTVSVTPTSSGGRRARAVALSRSAGLVLGVDFGHSHLRVAVGNLAHEVLAESSLPIDVDVSSDEGLTAAVRLVDELLAGVGADRSAVLAVGLGLPGPIDAATGVLGSTTILPGWVGVNPREELARRLGLPVHVDNDANIGALAEMAWGAARGCADAAYIKVASGVGAGILVGGRVYRGAGGTAGEIGHITVDESGRMCRCGNRGCLETYAGGPFLVELLRSAHPDAATLRDVVDLALSGDVGARRVVADAGRYVGLGVAHLCNVLNPSCVVVGGELARAGELLLDPVREGVRRYAIPSAAEVVRVARAEMGERAEVLGALALALHELAAPF
ncbi:MAG: ROK family protein [Streptosporangiales bacterium]|nr:ROK family protein [Streptosporangiales bacterium]